MSRGRWPHRPPGPRGTAHFDVHVPVELRDGRPRQPAPQVEPVAVLRHHVPHLRGTALSSENVPNPAQSPQTRGGSGSRGASQAKPGRQAGPSSSGADAGPTMRARRYPSLEKAAAEPETLHAHASQGPAGTQA